MSIRKIFAILGALVTRDLSLLGSTPEASACAWN
jgi:hypothetical protein